MYLKIVNPMTGRKVNVNGRVGRQILRNYIMYYQRGGVWRSVTSAFSAAVTGAKNLGNKAGTVVGLWSGEPTVKDEIKMLISKPITTGFNQEQHENILNNGIKLIDSVIREEEYMKTGIFRLAGENDVINEAEESMTNGDISGSELSPHDKATLIKRILRILKKDNKIKLNNSGDIIVALQTDEETDFGKLLQGFINKFYQLCIWVMRNSETNKMTPSNLSIVIAPNLYTLPDPSKLDQFQAFMAASKIFQTQVTESLQRKLDKSAPPDTLSIEAVEESREAAEAPAMPSALAVNEE